MDKEMTLSELKHLIREEIDTIKVRREIYTRDAVIRSSVQHYAFSLGTSVSKLLGTDNLPMLEEALRDNPKPLKREVSRL